MTTKPPTERYYKIVDEFATVGYFYKGSDKIYCRDCRPLLNLPTVDEEGNERCNLLVRDMERWQCAFCDGWQEFGQGEV